jgi:AcrR family transcriptional regulator
LLYIEKFELFYIFTPPKQIITFKTMKEETKQNKESKIITAAEQVFSQYGFKNSRMEEVAQAAGITKVTLYAYFKSKENLYMAITYKALTLLVDKSNETIKRTEGQRGIDSVIAITETFMDFCEQNYLYSEVLLDYFSLIRNSDESKFTDALIESTYFEKVKELQNVPFKLTAKQIQRGIDDGSISNDIDPNTATLYGWTAAVGYVKVSAASGNNSSIFFKVRMSELKKYSLDIQRKMMANKTDIYADM